MNAKNIVQFLRRGLTFGNYTIFMANGNAFFYRDKLSGRDISICSYSEIGGTEWLVLHLKGGDICYLNPNMIVEIKFEDQG